MKFSICIPNYNYENYLGRTLQSVLDQDDPAFEIVVSDNASTDGSVALVRSFRDARITVGQNERNLGFAGNLDCAVRMSGGDVVIVLSSDDIMRPGALAAYRAIYAALGPEASRAILSSVADKIDAEDCTIGRLDRPADLFTDADAVAVAGSQGPLFRVDGDELLRRCLRRMRNPFNFLATAFPRNLWKKVGGYGTGRLMNPDKWFHWRLLAESVLAFWVDRPLFAYRWHPGNQTAQQGSSGALKILTDDYLSTLQLEPETLRRLGVPLAEVIDAFVEYDIARHGLATLARGDRLRARRILRFGEATYPESVRRNPKALALRALIAAGPIGLAIARRAYQPGQTAGLGR